MKIRRAATIALAVVISGLRLAPAFGGQGRDAADNAPSAPAAGDAPAGAARTTVKVVPSRLSLARVRGAVETRRLQLHASGGAVKEVSFIASDLTRADGYAVLPADKISFKPGSREIGAGGVSLWEVTFSLDGAPSGEFNGDLLVKYQGGEQVVPVTLRVKDYWPWPLLLLLAGIIISLGLSSYRGQGRPRDEVLVREGQLKAQMRSDAELGQPFRQRIEEHLVGVEAELRGEKWEAARTAMTQAEAVWDKWRKWRADWLAQLASQAELEKSLKARGRNPDDHRYLQIVWERLKTTVRDAPGLDHPEALRKQLNELREQIYRYEQLASQIEDLGEQRTRGSLPAPRDNHWRDVELRFARRLEALPPEDESQYQALEKEVEQAAQELAEELSARTEAALNQTRDGQAPAPMTPALPLVPSIRLASGAETPERAHTRLRWFTRISYALVVALLAGIGFSELYVAKPTFGANAWGDYFALLAWGFGAEFTTASIKGLVSSWGLPSGN